MRSGIPLALIVSVLSALPETTTGQATTPLLTAHVRYSADTVSETQDTFKVAPFDRVPGDDAVLVNSGFFQVFRNGGNGICPFQVQIVPQAIWLGLTVLDVERDGDLDVIAVANGREPILLLNDGNADFTLAPANTRFPGSPVSAWRVAAADVDGDGFDDLLIGAVTNYQSQLWRNDGTGRFVDISATHLPLWSATVADIQPVDLDRDGDVDFVLAQGYGVGRRENNAILLNQGGGRFTYQPLASTLQTHSSAAVADFTGDGLPDIVFGNPDAASEYWINMGGGQFFDATSSVATILRAFEVVAGDIDGDGWPDLVITSFVGPPAHMELHLNQGGRGFVQVPGGIAQLFAGISAANMFVRDMDQDGDLDVVVRANNYYLSNSFGVFLNTTRHVLTEATVPSGGTWRMTLWARPQDFVVPVLAGGHVATDLGSLGTLGLDPASLVALPAVPMTAWSHTLSIPVPTTPWLIGRRIWAQAAVVSASQPLAPRLTNWLDTRIVR